MARLDLVKRALAKHRRSPLGRRVGRWLGELQRGYENVDYSIYSNGEARVLRALSGILPAQVLFDVGAHVGEWTRAAAEAFPRSQIHSFEPLPETFERLEKASRSHANVRLNRLALADHAGALEMRYPPGATELASCIAGFTEKFQHLETRPGTIEATTGDHYCREHGIDRVDFLKLDVEGYEHKVLRGFETFLREGRVKVIQFEYGYVNIETRFLLKDFYELLEPLGMRIGKIFPTYVDFRGYRHAHEDFLGPNFLAVHRSLDAVIAALA
jgi:FkbM family methyltransferase